MKRKIVYANILGRTMRCEVVPPNTMKILKQVTKTVKTEIGNLDGVMRLPTAARIARGLKTKCDACGEEITDEIFVGGFKAGQPNLKLHVRCAPTDL